MKKNNKSFSLAGLSFTILGAAIIAMCIFPSKWMLGIVAIALIVAGVMLIKN